MSDEVKTTNNGKEENSKLNLKVKIRPIGDNEKLLGYASVVINDCFAVDGIKIGYSEKGPYVQMPSMKGNDGNWRDICMPITAEFRQQLNNEIFNCYNEKIEQQQAKLQAVKSTFDALKENTEKVKEQPIKMREGKDAFSK